jgi:glutathione S-transferase
VNHGGQRPAYQMTAPTLYGASYSVYTRIARLALLEKGVDYAFEEVDVFGPGGPPSSYLRLHPFGRIPALRHDGFELFETQAICRYVDEGFAGRPLQPATAQARARMAQIVGLLDAYAYRPMVWDIFVERVRKPPRGEPSDEAKIAAALLTSERCLAALEGFLGGGGWFVEVDDEPSLADLHAAPMLVYLAAAPEGAVLLRRHAAIAAWLERMQTRRSMLALSPLVD